MPETSDMTLGIEEEYLLVDPETGRLAPAPDALMRDCHAALGDRVSPEFLRCQIEVGTPVCTSIAQARDQLAHLRRTVARVAGDYGLAPISASCHPFADWRDQHHTDKDRYRKLSRDMGAVSQRMLICGMHVHVGITSPDLRIDLMNRMTRFLPLLLGLSASSPFWQGSDTGLASYRTTVFGAMPRTGFPPRFADWDDHQRSVQALIDLGILEDASRIWWDLRPSSGFPTLETRVCDASPRLEDTVTLAALIQATARMLCRLPPGDDAARVRDAVLLGENRWRAIRYGMTQGLIDLDARRILSFAETVDRWLDLVAPDAQALDSQAQVARARDIVAQGGSAARQRAVLARATAAGATPAEAMVQVVGHLIDEFGRDL